MSIQTDIAAAVWTYATRTLASGTPDAPTTPETWSAKAIWEYATRTLSVFVGTPLFCELGPQLFVGGARFAEARCGGALAAECRTGGAEIIQVVRGEFHE